ESENVQQALKKTHELLAGLLHHEHASLALAKRCSSLPKGIPLFSSLLNYRYSPKEEESDSQKVWDGMEVLSSKARNNYPVTLSVDDLGEGFNLVALVDETLEGESVCQYMCTILEGITEVLADDRDFQVLEIDLLSEAEKARIQ